MFHLHLLLDAAAYKEDPYHNTRVFVLLLASQSDDDYECVL